MAFIKTVSPKRATAETAEVYKYIVKMGGSSMIPNIVQVFSLRHTAMKAMIRTWELSMWIGDESRQTRELAASIVSRLNECHY